VTRIQGADMISACQADGGATVPSDSALAV
jgi:hypothetical protein